MKIIHRHQIERLFKDNVYERGLTYYQDKRVTGLSYNKNSESWFAEVHGTEDYYVEINLSELEHGKIISYCDCPAFDTYHTCKHLVAVLLSISDKKPTPKGTYQMTSSFMDTLMEKSDSPVELLTSKLPIQVEYLIKFTYNDTLLLELKAGMEHRYVIRNSREFLDHVLSNESHFFTKKFTYDPAMHYFLTQDLEIFTLLASFIATADVYTNRSYFENKDYDKRSLPIPPINFKQLMFMLKERNVTVETADITYDKLEVIEETLPYQFTVEQGDEESFILKMDGFNHTIFLFEHGAVFSKGIFYFPKQKQLNMMNDIYQSGARHYELPLSGVNKDRFFSETLPILKKNTEVHIAEEITDDIVEYPLKATLYLQKSKEMITGTLDYFYGPYEVNPFNGKRQDKSVVIVRDTEKEQQIMQLIEESNFHYNGKELYISLYEDEEVYDFLYTILPRLDEYVELFLTSDIQGLIIESEPVPTTTVGMSESANLLEIGFDITGVNDDEVNALLLAVIEKKRFYRLDSGALVSLENDAFGKVEQLFDNLDIHTSDMEKGMIHVPVYKGLHVDELIDTKKYEPAFRKLLHSLKHPEEQVFTLPDNIQADLRHYQEVGFQWFKSLSTYHLGGILADDMGLGKTLQTITYLLSEPSDHPHLILVPSSVIYNWRNEINRFAPSLSVAVITGMPEERQKLIAESSDKDVWITSYGTIRQDVEAYKGKSFQTMILDEAQFIKNYQTKTSKAVRSIHASRCFALSGTPIENSVDELWAIFQVVLPGLLPPLKEFRHMEPKKIASLTKPFILRRLKEEVLKELPAKIESVHSSELTKAQKELYVGYLRELQEMTSTSIAQNHFQQNRMKILAGLTRLRQLCCHPSLFIENYEGRSGKLDELIEQVQTMLNSGRRLLIFSQFTSMHDLIMKELDMLDIDYFYLEGKTSAKKRVEMSEAFNNGEKNIFLISLRAGGTGLNLTGADTVILLDLWWNPAVEDQAAGRAHRFGQKKVVQVIRFITEGTIEEKIYELQQKKRELINQVIQPGETMLSSLSENDIKQLLSI